MHNSPPKKITKIGWPQLALISTTTCLALIAFAANSVLCRMALGATNIDPASFTAIRLFSGAMTLTLIIFATGSNRHLTQSIFKQLKTWRAWWGALMLTSYAVFFSFAYVQLSTASGALILFATVQFSMLLVNRLKGNRLGALEWIGLLVSFGGFLLLVFPNASRPSLPGLLMMMVAGIAWAFYTLAGKDSKQPILNTGQNFILSIPIVGLIWLFFLPTSHWNDLGLFLAIASGSLASGVGYALWYSALRHLSISQAAVSQLSVPLIAAVGGVLFVNESISVELILSGTMILTGIALVVLKKPTEPKQTPGQADVD
jgi:drug/metabolite transporter (DMT)-like permease